MTLRRARRFEYKLRYKIKTQRVDFKYTNADASTKQFEWEWPCEEQGDLNTNKDTKTKTQRVDFNYTNADTSTKQFEWEWPCEEPDDESEADDDKHEKEHHTDNPRPRLVIRFFMVLELGSCGRRFFLLSFPAQSRQQVSVGIAMNAMFIVIFFLVFFTPISKKSFFYSDLTFVIFSP